MLVPLPQNIDIKISENQSVFDIVKQIRISIKKSYKQANKIYLLLKNQNNNYPDFLKSVWQLSKKCISYQKEPFTSQTAKEFSRIYSDAFGDCKHFTTFISCILYNDEYLRDKIRLRIINHNGNDYTHIYAVVKFNNNLDYVLDGTTSQFNKEAKYFKKIDFKI